MEPPSNSLSIHNNAPTLSESNRVRKTFLPSAFIVESGYFASFFLWEKLGAPIFLLFLTSPSLSAAKQYISRLAARVSSPFFVARRRRSLLPRRHPPQRAAEGPPK